MHHIIPQAPCLVTSGDEWASDYVVQTEHLEEDMRQVRVRRQTAGSSAGGAGSYDSLQIDGFVRPRAQWPQQSRTPLFPLSLLSLLLQSCRCC